MDKKDFKQAKEPKVLKFEKVGDAVSGEFVEITKSTKFDSGYALKFNNEKDGLCLVFVNRQGRDLFVNNAIGPGDLFILEYKEDRENQAGTMKYRVYDLYYK